MESQELEESRRERETAKQDAFLHERRVDASEAELAKVLRDAKQKAETVDCLTSTLQARGVELAQKEKAMRDVNHELMLACRERDGSAQHNTVRMRQRLRGIGVEWRNAGERYHARGPGARQLRGCSAQRRCLR